MCASGIITSAVIYAQTYSGGVTLPFTPRVSITLDGTFRRISSNGIPNHTVGVFPGPGNPNTISPQNYNKKVPINPTVLTTAQPQGYDFGIAVNGVPFDPGTAELWNNNQAWRYEALSGFMVANGANRLGVDENRAHVQPTGAYHYHGVPYGLLKVTRALKRQTIIGWAADGYPVYYAGRYEVVSGEQLSFTELKSGYRLKQGIRPPGAPPGAYDGSFASDYEWVAGLGDLDRNNGRFGVTPDFPSGTYYYVITNTWPFIPRSFHGMPDVSFRKAGPAP